MIILKKLCNNLNEKCLKKTIGFKGKLSGVSGWLSQQNM